MKQIYDNIRRLRLNKNMTQSELAEILGYADKSMIAKIETGKVDLGQNKIIEFARALGVPVSELTSLEGYDREEEEMKENLSYNLRKIMQVGAISQLHLAEQLNVSQGTISNWISGTKMPRPGKINELCELFGISRGKLFGNRIGDSPLSSHDLDTYARNFREKCRPPEPKEYDVIEHKYVKKVKSNTHVHSSSMYNYVNLYESHSDSNDQIELLQLIAKQNHIMIELLNQISKNRR